MYDNNDIKAAIRKMEQGEFQNMCNKILFSMGYENINQLGSQDESNRTTPGTPDTFILHNGKYILVEYTVQKTSLFSKIKSDIEKCILEISNCNICNAKIIYFHTSSNLKMKSFKALNDMCKKEDIILEIYNIDMIANLLTEKYPLIAKDFLDISIDTLQILSSKDFLDEYNSTASSVKINKKLLFREEEKEKIYTSIINNEITLISGKSGVGKTHIVVDLLINDSERFNEYEIFCIRNRSQELFNDLKKYLKKDKNYVIFIDDINNINAIEQILYFLDPINKLNLKIVATVRDYAKSKVVNRIKEIEEITKRFYDISFVLIEPLSNEQLIEIIKSETKIRSERNIRNILSISKGNARLMMMAVKLLEKETKIKEYTVSDIYEDYYRTMINSISQNNPTIMKTLAIITIVNAIDINDLEHKKIIDLFGIQLGKIKDDMKVLHDNEIIDMIDENIAKISEQCLSNYSLFLSIVVKKEIDLSKLIVLMFSKNKSRLIENINMLVNVFHSEEVLRIINDSVKFVWEKINDFSLSKQDYLESFGRLLELETLDYCIENIKKLKDNSIKNDYYLINNEKNREYPKDKLLNLLSLFKYSNNLKCVINIILEYIKKDNSIIQDVYKLLVNSWRFEEEIHYNNFDIQTTIIEQIWDEFINTKNDDLAYLLLNLFKQYFKISGDYTVENERRSVTIIQYTLCECESLRTLRNKMFDCLICLCKNIKMKEYIIDVLNSLYSSGYGKEKNFKGIIENDKSKIYHIIELFKPFDFKTAIIINEFMKKFDCFKIKYKEIKIDNIVFDFYKLLINNVDDEFNGDHTRKNMQQFISTLNISGIKQYIKQLKFIEEEKLLENDYETNKAISTFLVEAFKEYKANANELLEICIINDVLKNFPISKILEICINNSSYNDVKSILLKHEYNNKHYFLINCYSLINEHDVNEQELQEIMDFISKKIELKSGYNIDLSFLDKYLIVDEQVYPKVIKIIYETYKENLFELSLYTSMLFNKHSKNTPEKLRRVFENNYDILMDLYLLLIQYRKGIDYDGTYFKMFLEINYKLFVDKYLKILKIKNPFYHNDNSLKYIWYESDEIINYTISKILEIEKREKIYLLKQLFFNEKNNYEKEEVYLIKLLKEYANKEDTIIVLFSIIAERSKECRINCFINYLKLNDDYDLFKRLQFESYSWSWSGSEVPIIDSRIEFFTQLMNKIGELGVNYIKHGIYLKRIIDGLELNKKNITRKEFLNDWY